MQHLRATGLEGSNNRAISAERTSTGRPILANDPHRAQSVPSLRYAVHLSAPGMGVIGAGEPALPGVSNGHNGKIAFGLTIFSIDQEDLYVYETNPQDPSAYRHEGRWERMEVELQFTRQGPVIYEDPEQNIAFAVRAAWLEPGTAPYIQVLDGVVFVACHKLGQVKPDLRSQNLRILNSLGDSLTYMLSYHHEQLRTLTGPW